MTSIRAMYAKPLAIVGVTAGLLVGAGALTAAEAQRRVEPAQPRAAAQLPGPPGRPASFADIVERVAPAVVSVETSRRLPVRGPQAIPGLPPELYPFLFPDGQNPFNLQPPGRGGQQPQQPPPTREARSEGSGFFVSADGYIVTNNHVVDGADDITVTLADGRNLKAEIVGRDEPTDLAVLKVEGRNFPFVNFSNTATPRVGDWVVALGSPFGLGGTATAGIVSAYGREVGSTYVDYIQVDAAINRGNSGGPTFDSQGRVIGVNTMIFSPSGGSVGIGFAIPAYIAEDVVKKLIADGKIERSYIGAIIQNLTPDIAESQGMSSRDGALVTELTPGAPAEAAGLQVGDIVRTFNGQPIKNTAQLVRRISATPAGQTLTLGVLRNGRSTDIRVRAALRPEEEVAAATPGPQRPGAGAENARLGVTISPLDEATRAQLRVPSGVRGVVVRSVEPDSDAAAKGLRAGDVITRANDRAITSAQDLAEVVEAARRSDRQSVLLFIHREGRQLAVGVRLTDPSASQDD